MFSKNTFMLGLLFLMTQMCAADSAAQPPVKTLVAVLGSSIESNSSTRGDQLILRTVTDLTVDGEIVIPRGSKLVAHLSDVKVKGKNEPESSLTVVIDKAVREDGKEIPLQAIVGAIAAPADGPDPVYEMMHSNEPKMVGGASTTASTGSLSPSSKSGSTAAVATATLKGSSEGALLLNDDSRGALGYEGVSLSWHLAEPPPETVFASKGKNLKLLKGTQMLLRMAPPRRVR